MAVVFGGNAGAILIAQEVIWMDIVMFSPLTVWRHRAPVLMDDELSVNFPKKKSRDVWK